jgi:hypothetical protein
MSQVMLSMSSEKANTYQPLRRSWRVDRQVEHLRQVFDARQGPIWALRRRRGMFQSSIRSSSARPMTACISVMR